ncbi:hypothetical protein K402DRAFT_421073 [Aulographum hederae CBS 113979]|uniref:Methyltransferase domain-containing protein n=1 Tax=Aulographum hederae CBS 113979 TaxID=1176131 RepID=A0A6G1H0L6_9PEZI|nr:hypothetical protein K402DRAFT_421073 [Aulographum hederae CBS 113979]
MSTQTAPKSIYTLNAGGAPSAEVNRLNKQQSMIQLVCPNIPPSVLAQLPPSPAIADVATGSAIWLLEVSTTLPSTAVLDGFDMGVAQFPSAESLPANVTLRVQNALDELPEEF